MTDPKNAALASSGDHAELARLAKAATPGPWCYRDMKPNTYGPAFVDAADVKNLAICGDAVGRSETHGFSLQVDSEVREANAAFIASANPATVLALIAENAALRGERDDLTRHRDRLAKTCQSRLEDWREANARATEAERKLAEAVGVMRVTLGDLDRRDVTAETANRIDLFLSSKEAA